MERKKGISALTSLRFLAAFLVFLDHYVISLFGVSSSWSLSLGYMAMTFFFTLSGFVLSYAYRDVFASNQITKFKFYIGRFARIWPLHILCLVIIIPFVWNAFDTNFRFTSIALLANVLLLQDIIPHTANVFNEPAWSISAEMFFYLCFPFLITLAIKKKHIFNLFLSVGFGLIFCIAIFFSANNQSVLQHNIAFLGHPISLAGIYYLAPPIRLIDFIVGISLFFIYECYAKKAYNKFFFTAMEILAFIFLAMAYSYHLFFPQLIQFDLLYMFPVVLILLVFSLEHGAISKILSHRKLILLGEASFAFYMLQEPVAMIVSRCVKSNAIFSQILHFLLLVFFAIIVHKYIEFPCYRAIRAYFNVKPQIILKNYLD